MSKQPIPFPTGGDLRAWAMNMVSYLRSVEADGNTPGPKIIQLEHKMPEAKASVDGLLMFDRTTRRPTYAQGGSWHNMYGGDGIPAQDNDVMSPAPHYDVDAAKHNNLLIVGRHVELDVALTRVMDFDTDTQDFNTAEHIGLSGAGVEGVSTGSIPLNNEATVDARSFTALIFNLRGLEAQVFVPARAANYILLGPVKTIRIRPNGAGNLIAGSVRTYPI